MQEKKIPKIVRWWVTPKLPIEHILQETKDIRITLRKWLVHPIKRRLARHYLNFLKRFFGLKVIAITGSAGKTSTKDMIYHILSLSKKTVRTYKNIDPIYNIPSTILSTNPLTKYLILEMGVEFPGEMDFYLWLAKADVAVITNIYPTHLEFLKSVNGVATEKSKLIKYLGPKDWAILNSENSQTRKFSTLTKAKTIFYGKGGIVRASDLSYTKDMKTNFTLCIKKDKIVTQLPMLGEQYVSNALAASAVCCVLGCSIGQIKKGLEKLIPPEHRMRPIFLKNKAIIFDDSYNNNPQAAKETIELFVKLSKDKKKIFVMGDMKELGKFEVKYHREIGKLINRFGIDIFIGVGSAVKHTSKEVSKKISPENVFLLDRWEQVLDVLKPLLERNVNVLIKGSRSIGLDNVVLELS